MKRKKFKAGESKNKNVIWFCDFVYSQEYCVIFAPTHEKFMELAEQETGFKVEACDFLAGEFHGLSTLKGGSLALIWSSDKASNLVHELFHACAWTLRNRGIHLSEDTEESYAYYLTFLLRAVKELSDYNNKNNKPKTKKQGGKKCYVQSVTK